MLTPLLRKKLLWFLPILFVVHILTFMLFFVVNSPDDIARSHLGQKYVTSTEILNWKKSYGLDKPLFYNEMGQGFDKIRKTIFFQQTNQLIRGDFGIALSGETVNAEIKNRVIPSLAIALPGFIFGEFINILVAMMWVYFRHTHLNQIGLIATICLLSISTLFYIIFAQYYMAFLWKWFPVSGYETGISAIYFVILPILVHVFSGLGSGARWYRTLLMEEVEQAYVTTAKANGLREGFIMVIYVLRNALLPMATSLIVLLPILFLGSVLFESFFAIPGLGSFLIKAINQQDFIVVKAMVMMGSLAYLLGLMLTDVMYFFIDPRVKIQ